ncbi:MAG: AraC family transcriptional regulator [Gemmatimonadaceae bacterium]|nr:AraC family transcriptional regulator [Gemmatimonadaceae bacterium]
MPRPLPTIAATSTLAMVRAAEARGVEVAGLLANAGLTIAALEDPDARLPAPTVMALWHTLRERTGDPALQLTAPTMLPFGAYRLIDYLCSASHTVGDAVQRFAHFFHLIAESLALTVEQSDDEACLTLAMADGGAVPPVYVDYVFAALVSRMRMRIRRNLRVQGVAFRQPAPPYAAAYRDTFDAPVQFGAARDRLSFSAAEWRAPTESADASLVVLLEEHARIRAQRAVSAPAGFIGDAQRALAATLSRGGTAPQVARELNVSVRTLQRRLVESGTTFRDVSEAVRSQLALGYLANPAISIAEVAVLLGFSEQSAFNRAFRRWTGESPGRWRRRGGGASA